MSKNIPDQFQTITLSFKNPWLNDWIVKCFPSFIVYCDKYFDKNYIDFPIDTSIISSLHHSLTEGKDP